MNPTLQESDLLSQIPAKLDPHLLMDKLARDERPRLKLYDAAKSQAAKSRSPLPDGTYRIDDERVALVEGGRREVLYCPPFSRVFDVIDDAMTKKAAGTLTADDLTELQSIVAKFAKNP